MDIQARPIPEDTKEQDKRESVQYNFRNPDGEETQ